MKRYDLKDGMVGSSMQECADGDWVKFDDVEGEARELRKAMGISQDFSDWPIETLLLKAAERFRKEGHKWVNGRSEEPCKHIWEMKQYGATYHDLKCSVCGESKRETWD